MRIPCVHATVSSLANAGVSDRLRASRSVAGVNSPNLLITLSFRVPVPAEIQGRQWCPKGSGKRHGSNRGAALRSPSVGFYASKRAMTHADSSSRAIPVRSVAPAANLRLPQSEYPLVGISMCVMNQPVRSLAKRLAGREVRGVPGGQRCRRSGPWVAAGRVRR